MRLLEEYLSGCSRLVFNWAGWNCVHFTSRWVWLYERSNAIAETYVEDTLTARAALRYAQSFGGLKAAYSKTLARDPVSPLSAETGDIVFFESVCSNSAGTLGICVGASAAILHPQIGLSSNPMRAASCVWKITKQTPIP